MMIEDRFDEEKEILVEFKFRKREKVVKWMTYAQFKNLKEAESIEYCKEI